MDEYSRDGTANTYTETQQWSSNASSGFGYLAGVLSENFAQKCHISYNRFCLGSTRKGGRSW